MPLEVMLMFSRLFWLSEITLLPSSLGVLFEHCRKRDPYSVNQTRQSQVYSNSSAVVLTPGRQMVMPGLYYHSVILILYEFLFLFHFNLLTRLPWYFMRAVLE